ncbi:hypothetical protein J6590_077586 [Homalodisca vitripennis]|nr:hypothetical protein J6590_077586 [Homalodisca vitripennis]
MCSRDFPELVILVNTIVSVAASVVSKYSLTLAAFCLSQVYYAGPTTQRPTLRYRDRGSVTPQPVRGVSKSLLLDPQVITVLNSSSSNVIVANYKSDS